MARPSAASAGSKIRSVRHIDCAASSVSNSPAPTAASIAAPIAVVSITCGRSTLIPNPPANPPAERFAAATIAHGQQVYETNCSVCHGPAGISSGVLPDLRRSGSLSDTAMWSDIVIGGQLKDRGMVSFAKWISAADAEAARAYIGDRAKKLQAEEKTANP